jgi:hypothetical protein
MTPHPLAKMIQQKYEEFYNDRITKYCGNEPEYHYTREKFRIWYTDLNEDSYFKIWYFRFKPFGYTYNDDEIEYEY